MTRYLYQIVKPELMTLLLVTQLRLELGGAFTVLDLITIHGVH